MNYLGIDPGISGGWGLLSANGSYLGGEALPVIRNAGTAWIDGASLWRSVRHSLPETDWAVMCYVERVHAMPEQGVTSTFSFGVGFGSVLGAVRCMGYPIWLVTPQKWKRAMLLDSDKSKSLELARTLWPDATLARKKDTNVAEALLIAHYARRQHLQGNHL